MDMEHTYGTASKLSQTANITSDQSVRSVIIQGIDLLRHNNSAQYDALRQEFEHAFLPLCTAPHKAISVLEIPQDLKNSRLVDLAPVLTAEQGQKFCNELFDLCIPSLQSSINTIVTVRNGGKMDGDIKMGWLTRLMIKTLYRSIDTTDLVNRTTMTAKLSWKDDERGTVDRRMRIG